MSQQTEEGKKKMRTQEANLAQEIFRGFPLGLSILALICVRGV